MSLLVKIKIIVYRKLLVFCDSFVWVDVFQILVKFKRRESIWNLKYFSFLKNDFPKMAKQLKRWIPNPGILGSKPLGASKVNSTSQSFILLGFIKWVPETPGDQVVKSKLSPCSGSVALRQLNPIHKKGTKSFLSKIMQKFYSHINLNLTFKKIIHKSNLNFRLLPNFSFLSPLPKNIRCQDLISDVNFYLQNCKLFFPQNV